MPEKRNEEPETVKLTVWIWEAAGEGLKLNMEAFRSEYPHIDVEIQYMLNEDLYQKLMIAANMGDKVPDVVALETSHAARMVQIGALLDITEQASPYVDKMNAFKWADVTRDGKIYALPWDTGPVVMFYRRDLFAQAGLPWNRPRWRSGSKRLRITRKSGKRFGGKRTPG